MKKNIVAITGGAGHIGKKIAIDLASKNVNVVIIDKVEKNAKKLVESLNKNKNSNHSYISADLSDPKIFQSINLFIKQKYGKLDGLINNAAFYDKIDGWGVGFDKEGYEAWLKVMQVNLLAPFFLVQSCCSLLKKSKYASVINIASIYSSVAPDPSLYKGTKMINPAAYSASKGGLVQLTKWLSTMLAPDIRVNAISPGGISRSQIDKFKSRYEKRTPLGRMANEKDVANAVIYLLSKESSYITGQNIFVDGGWSVW